MEGKNVINFVKSVNSLVPFLKKEEEMELELFYAIAKEYERVLRNLIEKKVFSSIQGFFLLCRKKGEDKRIYISIRRSGDTSALLEKEQLVTTFLEKANQLLDTRMGEEFFSFPMKVHEGSVNLSVFSFLKKLNSLGFSVFISFKDCRGFPVYSFLTVEGFLLAKLLESINSISPLAFSYVSTKLEEYLLSVVEGVKKTKDPEAFIYGMLITSFPVFILNHAEKTTPFDEKFERTLRKKVYNRTFYRKRLLGAMLERDKFEISKH